MPGSPKRRARRERFEAWTKSNDGFDQLLEAIGNGTSLSQFCRSRDYPYSSTHNWISADPDRAARFAAATLVRADYMGDDIERLVDQPVARDVEGRTDTGAVQHRRLQVDTKRWLMAKMHPRKFDDRLAIDQRITGEVTHQVELKRMSDDDLEAAIRRNHGLPADGELTDDMLLEIAEKAELRRLSLIAQMAERRGLRPAQRPRLTYQPARESNQANGTTPINLDDRKRFR